MELRPVQTALLAGRAASRWSSSPSTRYAAPIQRHIHTSRSLLKPAEAAAAAAPETQAAPSMASYMMSRAARQRQQPQQQQQQQTRPSGRSQGWMDALLKARINRQPENSTSTSTSTSTNDSASPLFNSWAKPENSTATTLPVATRRRAQSIIAQPSTDGVDNNLLDLGVSEYARPSAADMSQTRRRVGYEFPQDVKYRLRPVVGRTIECDGRVDMARALLVLGMKLKTNSVARHVRLTRFHERPGLKKKRLRRERWRVKFKEGFRATCDRVRILAKQGW